MTTNPDRPPHDPASNRPYDPAYSAEPLSRNHVQIDVQVTEADRVWLSMTGINDGPTPDSERYAVDIGSGNRRVVLFGTYMTLKRLLGDAYFGLIALDEQHRYAALGAMRREEEIVDELEALERLRRDRADDDLLSLDDLDDAIDTDDPDWPQ